MQIEPEGVPKDMSYETWKNKSIESCILTRDPECVYGMGSIRDSSLAYFCGQEKECMEYGTKFALSKAKTNIEMYYPVVAVLEKMEESLQLCELLLPQFFQGATKMWNQLNSK